mmetsp:Transcript_34009/g.55095  ORF Transcript_34009/g.55095 Transcript_34009/m.55095 type:complete len:472 (-) Transcript_34009:49-1464(-)|eukprot:CAMPEP_0184653370 /NCGR_PEP_ID=MMETSP0308-20130426/11087_1 /TAXON_ID=38269 /ORGANISM="Gloeochaete witrockiana, Strain SAG 46.84" /LENGTH=471 /DNA_ID=CAMNT_0027088789 /DNA_START=80 /DNA_END=1495 /DNA_ORIENTATION=-
MLLVKAIYVLVLSAAFASGSDVNFGDCKPAVFCGQNKLPGNVFDQKQCAARYCDGNGSVSVSTGIPESISYTLGTGVIDQDGTVYVAVLASIEGSDMMGNIYVKIGADTIPHAFNAEPEYSSYDFMFTFPADNGPHLFAIPGCFPINTTVAIMVTFDFTNYPMFENSLYLGLYAFVSEVPCSGNGGNAPEPTSPPVIVDVWGDPHLKTVDGMGVTYALCGDYVLASGVQFSYQARFCPRGNEAASTCALALLCRGPDESSLLEVYSLGDSIKLMIDGHEISIPRKGSFTTKGLSIGRDVDKYTMGCGHLVKVKVFLRDDMGMNYLDASLEMARDAALSERLVGLLGTLDGKMDNDIVYRDGRVWNAGHGLDYVSAVEQPSLNEVQSSWAVQLSERMFTLRPKDSNAECRRSDNLRRKLMAAHMDESVMGEATAECRGMNLEGMYLRTCIFDYIATGGSQSFLASSMHMARN